MKNTLITRALILLICASPALFSCKQPKTSKTATITLDYRQTDIQNQFDTLYNHQQSMAGVYNGFIEQALAVCHDSADTARTITQDVFSSMYLNQRTGQYDCTTNTVFQFPDGNISAAGVFNLVPGDTIAPDHNFPITSGSGAYQNIYGVYTRKYKNGVYHVKLEYHSIEPGK